MKRNVDLTSNSDFSAGRILFLKKDYTINHPWNSNPLEISYGLFNQQLFPTGYVADIRHQKQYEQEYGNSCDRCGREFKDKPWDKQYCLCNECSEQLDYEMNSYNYQTKYDKSIYQELLNTTDDRVMIELNWRTTL